MVIQDWKRIRSGDTTTFIISLKNPKTHAVVDVSTASAVAIAFIGPNEQAVTKTGSLNTNGEDGKVKCTLASTDLTQVGTWQVQAHVTLTSGAEYRSEVIEIEVERAL